MQNKELVLFRSLKKGIDDYTELKNSLRFFLDYFAVIDEIYESACFTDRELENLLKVKERRKKLQKKCADIPPNILEKRRAIGRKATRKYYAKNK